MLTFQFHTQVSETLKSMISHDNSFGTPAWSRPVPRALCRPVKCDEQGPCHRCWGGNSQASNCQQRLKIRVSSRTSCLALAEKIWQVFFCLSFFFFKWVQLILISAAQLTTAFSLKMWHHLRGNMYFLCFSLLFSFSEKKKRRVLGLIYWDIWEFTKHFDKVSIRKRFTVNSNFVGYEITFLGSWCMKFC